MMNVAVLGASPKPDRIANKAIHLLREHGHDVVPVNPAYETIEKLRVVPNLESIGPGQIHTVTVYLNPQRSGHLGPALVATGASRVIFNPGAENPELQSELTRAGVEVVEACTLVLLRTKQF